MIVWTEQATQQLDQVHEYIALSNSKKVAAQVTTRIVSSVQRLTTFPLSGRPGRVPATRELVISNSPFVVAYSIENERVVILAIYHGAQKWPEVF
ncbi:MAG: type II toxin-antitoxin system RelE/ParE family toxin [Terriglobales bacterium]|jgi:toxin ParE1/3/4